MTLRSAQMIRPRRVSRKPIPAAPPSPSPRILFPLWKPLPGAYPFHRLIPPGEFPRPKILRQTDKPFHWAFATRAPPEALHATRVKRQDPFFAPEANQFDLSVPSSPLRWGNSPPDDSLSDGQLCLLGFQTPAPVTRHAPHGREGQRKKERVCMLPSAHVRTRMRAPARLYEKENYSKTTCCRPP